MLSVITLSLALLLGAQDAQAFFRMPCHDPVLIERADPILTPGVASGHLHTIMGGNGFGFNMTYESARSASCSTCTAKDDLSNYWIPYLYYQGQDGSFTPVQQQGGMTVYYLQRAEREGEKLRAFPPGFRMVAGSAKRRSYDETDHAQKAVTHVCLDYSGSGAGGEFPEIPAHNCPQGLRMQVFFPSCWDGVNLDSEDHKSHMAYPIENFNGGKCPDSHPVPLVSIFYEVLFETDKFADKWHDPNGVGHPFILSTGDVTGYGMHGDFVNGWTESTLQKAVDECTNNSGSMDDCFLEQRSFDEMKACKLPNRIDEPTGINLQAHELTTIAKLPGCNQPSAGPGDATMSKPEECGAITVPGGQPGEPTVPVPTSEAPIPGPEESTTPEPTTPEKPTETTPSETESSDEEGPTDVPTETEIPAPGPTLTPTDPGSDVPPLPTDLPVVTLTPTDAPVPTPSAPGPVAPPPAGSGWTDLGCYVDPVNPRALSGAKASGKEMTPTVCQEWCSARSFTYAATEHGGECFCGNELAEGAVSTSADKCDVKCEGDNAFACGGSGAMNLYQLGGEAVAPTSPPASTPSAEPTTSAHATTTRRGGKPWHHPHGRRASNGTSARRSRHAHRAALNVSF